MKSEAHRLDIKEGSLPGHSHESPQRQPSMAFTSTHLKLGIHDTAASALLSLTYDKPMRLPAMML